MNPLQDHPTGPPPTDSSGVPAVGPPGRASGEPSVKDPPVPPDLKEDAARAPAGNRPMRFDWSFDRTMWGALAAFAGLVALFTVVLRPYDTFNLGIFLYEGSYTALGQNPYAFLSIPAPPNLQLLGLGAYLSYAAYGYNLSGAVAFYKVANGVFAVLSALIVANITARLVPWPAARTRVFVALLLSPPIFFFSFVHVQLDIFGIFWSLLGIYLYFFSPPLARWDFLRVFAALALLAYAVYAYTIPIALFPALIIYQPTWRRRLLLGFGSAAALLLYLLPNFALWTYLPGNPVGSTAGSANSPYSLPFVLNNIPGYTWGTELLVVWAVLAVLVPALLRHWRVDVFGALIVSVVLVFLILPIYNGDEFIWLLPWLTLGLALYTPVAPSWRRLLLVQCVLLPLIVVFNFYDGLLGLGTGVFYLFYPQFSNPTIIWEHIPHAIQLAQLLMGSVFVLLVALAVHLVRRSRRFVLLTTPLSAPETSGEVRGVPAGPPAATVPGLPGHDVRTWRSRVATASPLIALTVFVALLVALSVAQPQVSVSFQTDRPGFATGMFLVHPPPGDNLSYTLANGGDTVVLPSTNPAFNGSVAFIRNTTDEKVGIGLSVGVGGGGTAIYNTTILDSPHLQAQVTSIVDLPATATEIPPSLLLNVSGPIPPPPSDENVGPVAYSYSGTSLTQYDLRASTGPSTTYSFFFELTQLPFRQNVIWSLTTGVVTSELVAVPTSTGTIAFELGTTVAEGSWEIQWASTTNLVPWNLVELTSTAKGLAIALDGTYLDTVPSSLAQPTLDVGRFSTNGSTSNNNSFVGVATEPVETPGLLSTSPGLEVEVYGDRSSVIPDWDGELNLAVSGGALTLWTAGHVWSANGSSWFSLGRLSASTVTLYLTLTSLRLSSEASNSLLAPFLLLGLVGPVVFALVPRLPSLLAGPRRGVSP